ncbi:MAG: hypothetical protein ACKVPX_05950 [Myxococcaceae bacterium]
MSQRLPPYRRWVPFLLGPLDGHKASKLIKGAVFEGARKELPLGRAAPARKSAVEAARRDFRASHGEEPSDAELCDALGWTPEELAAHRLGDATFVRIDEAWRVQAPDGVDHNLSGD